MTYSNIYFQTQEQLYTVLVEGKPVTVRRTGNVHKDNANRVEVQVLRNKRMMYVLEKNLVEIK